MAELPPPTPVDPIKIAEGIFPGLTEEQKAAVHLLMDRIRFLENHRPPPADPKDAARQWLEGYIRDTRLTLTGTLTVIEGQVVRYREALEDGTLQRTHVEGTGDRMCALAREVGRLDLAVEMLESFDHGALAQEDDDGSESGGE